MTRNRPLYIGPRLRRLRRELGLTQHTMATDLAISPSYVALLERNQRPVTADMLMRLARTYKVDVTDLASEDVEAYADRLTGTLRDPIFADIDVSNLEIMDLATNFPAIAEALLRLHGAYIKEQQALAVQTDGLNATAPDPVGEVRRFLVNHHGYFDQIDRNAETLAVEIAAAGGEIRWLASRGTRVRFLPPDVLIGLVRRHDRHHDQLLINNTLRHESRLFQIATHIAYSALRKDIAEALAQETFTTQTAAILARRALGAYGAGALRMPYEPFVRAARARHYDAEVLAREFSVSFEQVAHRLTSLSRQGDEGIAFSLIRVDEAGAISKWLNKTGFPLTTNAPGCTLWSIHAAFRQPDETQVQWVEFPDGEQFCSIARVVHAPHSGHTHPRIRRALALICSAGDMPELIYQDSMPNSPALVGITCRLCQRAQCAARSAPPISRDILSDDNRRSIAPFTFDEG